MIRIILSAVVLAMGILLSACSAQTDTENSLENTTEASAEVSAEVTSLND